MIDLGGRAVHGGTGREGQECASQLAPARAGEGAGDRAGEVQGVPLSCSASRTGPSQVGVRVARH